MRAFKKPSPISGTQLFAYYIGTCLFIWTAVIGAFGFITGTKDGLHDVNMALLGRFGLGAKNKPGPLTLIAGVNAEKNAAISASSANKAATAGMSFSNELRGAVLM
ncbi:tartrate dehydratase beta subunit/Fumarate hydratase class I, C-terminal domain [Lactiplantibacillus plantarum]|nr:tartrate dehydratase beta subunit/Fumarate hydratase class I, C-terminal domain [Lactiplantibacillus plantarum]